MQLPKWDSTSFTWQRWRAGSIHDFGIPCRFAALTTGYSIMILRTYAIGWCRGENLMCRPKVGHTAVMFNVNDVEFWFHLRNNEFAIIFEEDSMQ